MSFEEEFDRIIKQKAEHADFPFDGKNWEKAAAMLDGQKAVTDLPLWKKVIVPALLGVAAITTLVILLPSQDSKQIASSTAQNKTVLETKTADISLPTAVDANEEKATTPSNTLNTEKNQNISEDLSIQTNSIPSEKYTTNVTPKKVESKSNAPEVKEPVSSEETIRTVKPTSSTPKVIHTNTANQSSNQITVVPAAGDNSDEKVVDKGNSKKDEASVNTIDMPVADKNTNNISTTDDKPLPADISKVSTISQSDITENTELKTSNADFWLPSKSLLLEMPQDNATVVSNFEMLPVYLNDDYVKKAPRYYVSVLGGVHYAFGWETAAGKDGKGYNYFGGLEFGKYITTNLTVGAGLQYFTFSNIYQPYYTSVGKGYGFGYTQSYSGLTTDRINYLSVPLFVNYTSTDGFLIGAGITGNYLLGVHNRIDTYGISDGIKGDIKSEGNSTIYEGTKMFGMMANVRLGYTVFNRMNVFADLQYGLNDLCDSQTKKQTSERLTGLRFGLNYILIKK